MTELPLSPTGAIRTLNALNESSDDSADDAEDDDSEDDSDEDDGDDDDDDVKEISLDYTPSHSQLLSTPADAIRPKH